MNIHIPTLIIDAVKVLLWVFIPLFVIIGIVFIWTLREGAWRK